MTEIIAAGAAAGQGISNFNGQLYSFKLAGGVEPASGGASDAHVSGGAYGLNRISGFAGL